MNGLTDEQLERLQLATGHSGAFVRDVIAPVVADMLTEQREQVAEECRTKRDEFAAERREQIIEALSWWEDEDGRWGHQKACGILAAHEAEWCGAS